ncbi:ABC transporter permease subunit [Paenibacillus sp. LMG 31461]|uniref:ABC transporter permease subunit n=1 Tax=Paenibacillus plantarum TaxID=2654975 RepID=A0ABX1XGT0_9BACL|nr:ABC transporter permease [Paenibacillus plantarum]NOU67702.1 ABC transporter permease subunit [Paenibacillus plantarum]
MAKEEVFLQIGHVKTTNKLKWQGIPQWLSVILTLMGMVIVWQLLYVFFTIPKYILPSPWDIAVRFSQETGMLIRHSLVTLQEVLLGFLMSVAVGIPIAILIVHSKYFKNTIYPILIGVHCIPMVSLAPLLIIWLGFDMKTKVIIAFMISVFPIIINSVVGMQSMDKEMHDLARSLRASKWQIFLYFRLPKALPNIFGGFKVGITLAVVGAVVAEFVASDKGLGYLQLMANSQLDTTLEFCTLFMLAIIGIGLFYGMDLIERVAIPWNKGQRGKSE